MYTMIFINMKCYRPLYRAVYKELNKAKQNRIKAMSVIAHYIGLSTMSVTQNIDRFTGYRPLYRAVDKDKIFIIKDKKSYRPLYRAVYAIDGGKAAVDYCYRPLYRAVYILMK